MVEATVLTGAISQGKRMQIEALKRDYKAKECMAKNIISAVILNETTPHLHCDFVPLTKRESIGEKT